MATPSKPKITAKQRAEAAQVFRLEWAEFLLSCITSQVPDPEKTMLGAETVLKSPWNETEMEALKGKLFFLLHVIPLYNPDVHRPKS